jgi:hypothetical protein
MVPDMAPAPSQAAEEAARIILGHGQGAYQQELSSPTPQERTDASSAERPAEQGREPAGFRENVQVGIWCRVYLGSLSVLCLLSWALDGVFMVNFQECSLLTLVAQCSLLILWASGRAFFAYFMGTWYTLWNSIYYCNDFPPHQV